MSTWARVDGHGRATRCARRARAVRVLGLIVGLGTVVLAAGCGDTDFSSAPPDAGEVDIGALPRPPAEDLPRPTEPPETESPDTEPSNTETPTPDTESPDTESPGTESPDTTTDEDADDADQALCTAWSQLVTTREVLTMAADFGRLTDVQLARLEVVAAALVTDAVERLDAALAGRGAAVDAERPVVRQEMFGRFESRARASLVALDELSPSPDLAPLLAQVWLDGLRGLDPDATVPELADLGPEFGPIVDRAAAAFAADAPRWDDDPAFEVDDVEVPDTEELVGRTCPDVDITGDTG